MIGLSVNEMPDRQHRVTPDHPGAGITHDPPDLIPPVPLVTVNEAVGAGGFFLTVGTPVDPFHGIVEQLPALITKRNRKLHPVGVIIPAE